MSNHKQLFHPIIFQIVPQLCTPYLQRWASVSFLQKLAVITTRRMINQVMQVIHLVRFNDGGHFQRPFQRVCVDVRIAATRLTTFKLCSTTCFARISTGRHTSKHFGWSQFRQSVRKTKTKPRPFMRSFYAYHFNRYSCWSKAGYVCMRNPWGFDSSYESDSHSMQTGRLDTF